MQSTFLHNEKGLLVQVANSDEEAFRLLYDHYRQKIYAYACHLTASTNLADEVVQEVFLKVWLNRHKLPAVSNFNAWLYTITRNQLFDALKRSAKEANNRQTLLRDIPGTINNADEMVLDKENHKLLQQALSRLSSQQQIIYHLSRNQGMKYDEIARQLQIAPNTVKVHIVNALRTIREYIRFHTVHLFLLCWWLF
ncbi:MAG: RNA polymerase sigma-70 factor [Chitinophagaceae bacterium]|nr:RNA polymerase sigma-70 factor [Chitinophagaceae bacterium]